MKIAIREVRKTSRVLNLKVVVKTIRMVNVILKSMGEERHELTKKVKDVLTNLKMAVKTSVKRTMVKTSMKTSVKTTAVKMVVKTSVNDNSGEDGSDDL